VAILMGAAAPAMLRAGGEAPKRGKEWSSKSGSSKEESRKRVEAGAPTSIGLLSHGRWPSLPRSLSGLRLSEGANPTGVRGVDSLEVGRTFSLVAGE
jgi:hypothetical protein